MHYRIPATYLALTFLGSCLGETHTAVEFLTTLTTEITTITETAYVFDADCTEADFEDSPVASSTEPAAFSTESASDASPTTLLLPAVHWDQDTTDIKNLHPVSAGEPIPLFYSDGGSCDPNVETLIGSMTPAFNYTTVVLDHSDHVSDVVFHSGAGHLTVHFGSPEAYFAAEQTWNATNLLLITNTPGCGNHDGGERCYFVVTMAVYDESTLSATVYGESQTFADIVVGVTFEWGLWRPSASGTVRSAAPSASCVPPVDNEHGLPTACLGDGFDIQLDDELGYGDISEFEFADYVNHTVPGVDHDGDENFETSGSLAARQVIDTNEETVVIDPIKSTIGDTLESIPKLLSNAPPGSAWYNSFSIPSQNKSDCSEYSCILLPGSNASIRESKKWGKQLHLYSWDMAGTGEDGKKGQPFSKSEGINASDSGFTGSLDVYCVDCSATGSMVVSGKTSFFDIAAGLLGLNDGYVHVDVSSVLALKFGIEAELAYDTGYLETPLFTKSLSWISIAGAFEVGPSITISAGFALNAVASGSVLAGGQFTLDGASWRADLKTGNTTRSDNWMPRFDPIFKADGDITVSAKVNLPMSIDVSIRALEGLFEASAGVGDTPWLHATAQVSAELSLNKDRSITSSLTSDNNCTGISYKLSWENIVDGHVTTNIMDDQVRETWTLGQMRGDLLQDCFQLGSNSTDAVNSKRQSDNIVPSDHDDSDIILYSDPKIPSASYDTTDGFGFAGLRTYDDSDNMNSLYNCADDNFYVSTSDDSNFCSSQYRFRNDTVLLSADNSLMHYYGNTMARLGVSRLRTAPPEWIPRSSIYVSLIPAARLQYSEQLGYVARDMVGHIFFPVICEYKNDTLQSKVFVVEDLDEGIETLKSPSVVYSVTNGEVEECWPLPLILGDD